MKSSIEERRRSARVPVSMRVGEGVAGATIGFGYAQNISSEGLALGMEAVDSKTSPPNVGDRLRLRFKLPASELVITAVATVIRADSGAVSPLLALRFTDLSPEFREEIERFVSKYHR